MKYFDWDEAKNQGLIINRDVTFTDVVECIIAQKVIAIEDNHPPYAHQKILVIEFDDYLYEVPFVEDDTKIFFKTVYSSRRAMRKYKNL